MYTCKDIKIDYNAHDIDPSSDQHARAPGYPICILSNSQGTLLTGLYCVLLIIINNFESLETICARLTPSLSLQTVSSPLRSRCETSAIRVSVRPSMQKSSRRALHVAAAAADAYAQSTLDPIEK